MTKIIERYFTTQEQGMRIVEDALNAGLKHSDRVPLKKLKKDIKTIMEYISKPGFKHVYGIEEDEEKMIFSVFIKIQKIQKIEN